MSEGILDDRLFMSTQERENGAAGARETHEAEVRAEEERAPCPDDKEPTPEPPHDSHVIRAATYIQTFIRSEAASGLLLMLAAVAAMVAANHAPLTGWYETFLNTIAAVRLGNFAIEKPILLWINDGLMAIFFLLVGLELKREFLGGELASRDRILMPAVAAAGGMIVPALVFVLVVLASGRPELLRGWAIPTATDIAFALGMLSLLGRRVPLALKTFLLALAMFDDLGAIVIIAVFYSHHLDYGPMAAAGAAIGALILLNVMKVRKLGPYLIIGLFMWASVLKSGIHATLAGFVLALLIPYVTAKQRGHEEVEHVEDNPALVLEHALVPYVAYFVMPIFAFANAGVALPGSLLATLAQPLTLGIMAGLVLGKTLGVFGSVQLATRLGLLKPMDGVRTVHLLGVAMLTGIGFTMSLFIGTLSFDTLQHAAAVRIGVLGGTLLAAAGGLALLALTLPRAGVAAAGKEASAEGNGGE